KLGIDLGDVRPVAGTDQKSMLGGIVMCPPSALGDRWSRRFGDPVNAFASGWMRIRGRARQGGIELPLVVSDHVDWPELIQTISETGAEEIWVTHGREDARRGRWRSSAATRGANSDACLRPSPRLSRLHAKPQSQGGATRPLFQSDTGPGSRMGAGGVDRRRSGAAASSAHADGPRQPLHRSGSLSPVA